MMLCSARAELGYHSGSLSRTGSGRARSVKSFLAPSVTKTLNLTKKPKVEISSNTVVSSRGLHSSGGHGQQNQFELYK
ncbi:MAG: hypothetical protein JWN30_1721 [Bacilli bacterium]|nr:hypothetical protein [Bacilli bacterium]